MGRKKRGGKKGRDDPWSDEEPAAKPAPAADAEEGGAKMSRKAKRQAKQQAKQQVNKKPDSDSDDDDDDDLAMLLGGGKNLAQYGSDSDDDDDNDDDDDDDLHVPAPVSNKKNKGKNKKKQQQHVVSDDEDDTGMGDEDDEDDEDDDDGDDGDDDADVEQFAFKILDEPKKKKKDKKEKKEKKSKKDKKDKKSKKEKKDSSHRGGSDEDRSDSKTAEEAAAPAAKQKSKLELQMETAMKKKEEEAIKKSQPAPKKQPAQQQEQQQDEEESKVAADSSDANAEGGDEPSELMYGAPDDVVWSDKSQAMVDQEANAGDDGKNKLMYGANGKKLSNKERKRLQKQREAEMRAAEYEAVAAKASREGAQFACSQTAVNEKDPQWENALDISIPNFSISAAGKILFKDAAISIAHGRRYGLVGPNGRGKSTLLKMIASRDLKLPPRIDFLYVEQEVVADDTPAVDAVLKADKHRWDLMEEEKTLMKKIDDGDDTEKTIDRLEIVVEELTNMGAASSEAKARRILYGLGFSMEMQTKPTKMFSGGWRMRISLARALFIEPTLLMLDEPTNHLDLNAVIWLDEYLQKWKKTLLVVSHDQDFLNSVCQEMLHIEDLKLISYKGDYDTFKRAQKDKLVQQVKAWEKQEKRLRELKRSGQSKNKAQETMKKSSKREAGARSQKKKNQAIAAGTETAEIVELIKRPKEYTVQLEFADVNELSRPVMEVNNVNFRYSAKHPVIFDNIDFGIDMDSRICVVGPNGAGKSTLLKLLTGEIQATKGEVKRNPRLRMGIYNQHFVDRLPMNKTPVDHLRSRFEDLDYQTCRNRLGKYGLEGHAHEVVMRDLSGGQKARVVFVELSLQEPHILLLDEPTNNLDIETIDALVEAVNEFNGGIVVVTHDQRLIEECDCTLWVVEKQGVTEWTAGFDDYKESILKQLEEEVERENKARREKVEAAEKARAEKIARLAKNKKK